MNLTNMRAKIESLLPDTCDILTATKVTDDAGNTSKTYAVATSVNCRFDPTRQYRSSDIFDQEAILNDYMVTLPYGTTVAVDNRLRKGGTEFEVRKVIDAHSWAVSTRVLVTEVEKGY